MLGTSECSDLALLCSSILVFTANVIYKFLAIKTHITNIFLLNNGRNAHDLFIPSY